MNRCKTLIEKLKQREKVVGTTMSILDEPILLDRMSNRVDFVLMDMEHGRFDTQNALPMLHACRMLGLPSIVRVQDSQYHLIAKAIDMGADGVMIPRVEEMEQIRVAIDAVCFSPIGRKGVGGYAQFKLNEHFEEFQQGRLLMPQIESARGIENLPRMLEAHGGRISAVIVGPYDLSVMLGTPLQLHSAEMEAAVKEIFRICLHFGKSCGIFCDDALEAARYRKHGANVLWTASDMQFYMRGFAEVMDEIAKID